MSQLPDNLKPSTLELIKFALEAGEAWSTRRNSTTRSALLKLALTSTRLHIAALSKGIVPRDAEGGSKALAVANTALETVLKNQTTRR